VRFYLRKYDRSPYWYYKLTSREKGVVQDWQSTGKRIKRDANEYAADKVRAFETSDHPVTLDEAIELLAAHKERKGASDATMEKLSLKASHLRTYFGPSRNVLTLSVSETTAYLDKRRTDGVKDSTIEMELRELRAALRQLKRFGRYHGEPSSIWPDELKRKFPGRKRWLPFEQYEALVNAMRGPTAYYREQRHGDGRHGGKQRRRQLITHSTHQGRDWSEHLIMYTYTSMRFGELYKPSAADIDGQQLRIAGTKTDEADRLIPLHPEALRIVRARAKRYPTGPLFPLSSPSVAAERRAWLRALRNACRRIGIAHTSTNDLRRTFCSWCFQNGVPMELVIKWMGHASSKMVMEVYAQPSEEQGRREIAKLPSHPAVTQNRGGMRDNP
jgi:integrase